MMIIKIREPAPAGVPKTDYGYKHPLDDYPIGTVVNWIPDDANDASPPPVPDGWERFDRSADYGAKIPHK